MCMVGSGESEALIQPFMAGICMGHVPLSGKLRAGTLRVCTMNTVLWLEWETAIRYARFIRGLQALTLGRGDENHPQWVHTAQSYCFRLCSYPYTVLIQLRTSECTGCKWIRQTSLLSHLTRNKTIKLFSHGPCMQFLFLSLTPPNISKHSHFPLHNQKAKGTERTTSGSMATLALVSHSDSLTANLSGI